MFNLCLYKYKNNEEQLYRKITLFKIKIPSFKVRGKPVVFALVIFKFNLFKNYEHYITSENQLWKKNVFSTIFCSIAFQCFYDNLYKIYNSVFEVKTKSITININKDPWITPNLRKCIKKSIIFIIYSRGAS